MISYIYFRDIKTFADLHIKNEKKNLFSILCVRINVICVERFLEAYSQ